MAQEKFGFSFGFPSYNNKKIKKLKWKLQDNFINLKEKNAPSVGKL